MGEPNVLVTMHQESDELWSKENNLNDSGNEDVHLAYVSDHENNKNPIAIDRSTTSTNSINNANNIKNHTPPSSWSSISASNVFENDHPSLDKLTQKSRSKSTKPRKSRGKNDRITLKLRKVTKYRRKADGIDVESYDCYQVFDAPESGGVGNVRLIKPTPRESNGKTERKRKAPELSLSSDHVGRVKQYNLAALANPLQKCAELGIRDLPKKVLSNIFNNVIKNDEVQALISLIALSQVCEEWRQIILDSESLWRNIDFSCMKATSASDLIEFAKLGVLKHAKHLSFNGWNDMISVNSLARVLESCSTNLKSISFRECYEFDGQCLTLISKHCPQLEELDFSRVSDVFTQSPNKKSKNPGQTPLFPACFQEFIIKNGSNLRSLTLAENKILKLSTIFDTIMEQCNNLQCLDLSNITSQSSFAVPLDTLQESCPKLKILRLGNMNIRQPKGLYSGFPLLEELSIPCNNSGTGHSEAIISCLTNSAENLKLLDIRGSSKVTSSCLIKIPAWNLEHLAIDNCLTIFSNGLEMVVSKWKHSLIELDVSHNNHQDGISAALELISSEKNSPLQRITLRGSSLSFESVSKLVMNCANLKMIDLQSCRALPRGTKKVFRGQEILEFREEITKGFYI